MTGRPPHGLFRRLHRACGGATAIEMAFLLPVFLLFLVGIEEFGRALWTQTALQFAVEAAARCAAVSPSLCKNSGGTIDVPGYAATQAFGLSIPSSAFSYTQNAVCGVASSSTGSGGAQVSASYAFNSLVDVSGFYKLLGTPQGQNPLNVTLSAKSCHP